MSTSWAGPFFKKMKVKNKEARLTAHQKTMVGEIAFPSKFEASIYQELLLREKAGTIRDIRMQQTIRLAGKAKWKVDFIVFDIARGCDVAHEAKGVKGARFQMVLQLWPELGPMLLIVYYQGKWGKGYTVKEYKGRS